MVDKLLKFMDKYPNKDEREPLGSVLAEDPISQLQAWLLDDCLARNLDFDNAWRLETARLRLNSPS